jgi:predicted RNA-binding protein YlqC (UPF0109 family)
VAKLLYKMVSGIVDTPSVVKVEAVADQNLTLYLVEVPGAEVGQVIGKQGRTARSLRTILAAVSMKETRRSISLADANYDLRDDFLAPNSLSSSRLRLIFL